MKIQMLDEINSGKLPSQIFRNLITVNPLLGNIQIGEIFCDEFLNVSSLAQQIIWHWKGPGKVQGLNDEGLDAELIRLLKEAGYLGD